MAYLLTGGTGKAAEPLIKLFQQANLPFVLTSRKGQDGAPPGTKAVRFDWNDASTFEIPFKESSIKAIYLVSPLELTPEKQMNPFIDLAVKHGVKRFVMVAGGTITKGGYWLGQVWQHLDTKGVEYSVLRPSWFLENLLQPYHVATIREENKIYSGMGDGRAAHLTVKDIAQVAFSALTREKPAPQDLYLLGPELLNYDEVATRLSAVLGRNIEHVKLNKEDNYKRLEKSGEPIFMYQFFASLEEQTKEGKFNGDDPEKRNDVVTVLARPATTVRQWAEENKEAWL